MIANFSKMNKRYQIVWWKDDDIIYVMANIFLITQILLRKRILSLEQKNNNIYWLESMYYCLQWFVVNSYALFPLIVSYASNFCSQRNIWVSNGSAMNLIELMCYYAHRCRLYFPISLDITPWKEKDFQLIIANVSRGHWYHSGRTTLTVYLFYLQYLSPAIRGQPNE